MQEKISYITTYLKSYEISRGKNPGWKRSLNAYDSVVPLGFLLAKGKLWIENQNVLHPKI